MADNFTERKSCESFLSSASVVFLLFEVGLESTVQGMMKVGASALLVAVLGVIAPFILGFGVSWFFIKELPTELAAVVPANFSLNYIHMFIGAVLRLIGVSILFLGGALVLGVFLVPKIMKQLAKLRTAGVMLISALLFAFALSYLANAAGLAAIVGAFAAGLILEEVHFHGFREEITIEKLLKPIATFLVPIFFVLMGIQVRLETFADLSVLGVAAGLTIAAIIGKQICGLGVLETRRFNLIYLAWF